ncbi:MAG: hypothetical protein H0T71_01685 [Acidobacteria bacterium]|nr:hypothetical protein [Acidobacteriota bacterium]
MTEQSYASHGHHPIPTYVAAVFGLVAIVCLVGAWAFGWPTHEAGTVSLSLSVAALVAISRLYTTRLQDRLILLEMKVRCAEVLPAGQDERLGELSPRQVVALRFASDAELGALLDRAIREHMPPRAIKQAITHWRGDHFRA